MNLNRAKIDRLGIEMHLNSILRVWPGDKEQSAGSIQGQVHFTRKYLN